MLRVSVIDNVSSSLAGNSDSAEALCGDIQASVTQTEELISRFSQVGVESSTAISTAVKQMLESSIPQLQAIKSTLDDAHSMTESLRTGGTLLTTSTSRSDIHAAESTGAHSSVTQPLLIDRSDRSPFGSETPLEGSSEKRRSLRHENQAASILAQQGYLVEQNPDPKPNGRAPDYKINGQYWDCYSPTTARTIDKIRKKIKSKVGSKPERRQADRIVLVMDDNPGTDADLQAILKRRPIEGLREIKVLRGQHITTVFPANEQENSA